MYLFFYGRYIQLAAGSLALAILGTGSDETYMIRIANLLGEDVQEINEWMSRTKINFYKYFLPNGGEGLGTTEEALFCSYDLLSKDWIRKRTISSLVPIFTGLVSKEEIDILVKWVTHSHWSGWEGRCHSPVLPSADLEEPYFRPLSYWRGPVWVNANWMIWLGLLKYGYRQISDQIKNNGILELAATHGFREYYDAYTGEGLGGKSFSWTAALVIDMIKDRGIGIPPND